MRVAAAAMSSPGRFSLVERALKLGRLIGRSGRIRSVPGPGAAAWFGARDMPAPPAETFRQWWARTRGPSS